MRKTRRNRVVAVLGAGGVLAGVLGGAGTAARAQTVSARALNLPTACVAIEALVSDGASGPGLGGEVLRVSSGGQSILVSDDVTPSGGQQFDNTGDVQYDACENAFYVLETGFTPSGPRGKVLQVDAATGVRSLFAKYSGAANHALLLRPIPVQLPTTGGGTTGPGDPGGPGGPNGPIGD
jgi:hypothetical protein